MKPFQLLTISLAILALPIQSLGQVGSSYMDQFFYTHLIDGFYYFLISENMPEGPQYPPAARLTNGDIRYYKGIVDTTYTNSDSPMNLLSNSNTDIRHNQPHICPMRPTGAFDPVLSPLEQPTAPSYVCDTEFYKGDITIPYSVTYKGIEYLVDVINDHGMACNPNLTSVKLPKGMYGICDLGFFNCPKLESIEIPADVPPFTIWQRSIEGTAVKELFLPDSLSVLDSFCWRDNSIRVHFSENQMILDEEFAPHIRTGAIKYPNISDDAFLMPKSRFLLWEGAVSGVRTVIIPPTDRFAAQQNAISGCETIVSMATEPPVIENPGTWLYRNPGWDYSGSSSDVLDNMAMNDYKPTGLTDDFENVTLVVPAGCEDAYRNAPIWSQFTTIKGADSMLDYLGAGIGQTPDSYSDAEIEIGADRIIVAADYRLNVAVFDTSGRTVASAMTDPGSSLEIRLAPGFYIVRTGTKSHKIKI